MASPFSPNTNALTDWAKAQGFKIDGLYGLEIKFAVNSAAELVLTYCLDKDALASMPISDIVRQGEYKRFTAQEPVHG